MDFGLCSLFCSISAKYLDIDYRADYHNIYHHTPLVDNCRLLDVNRHGTEVEGRNILQWFAKRFRRKDHHVWGEFSARLDLLLII